MAVTPTVLYTGGQLGITASTLAAGASNTTATIISTVSFCNTDTVAHTITVYIVRSGGTAGVANEIISARQLSANSTYTSVELQNQILNPGDTIQALADTASKVTCAGIAGYVVTS